MLRLPFVLFFVAMTFLCWGNYGPLMHHGQIGMGGSRFRAFIGVGLAYFLIAVVVPLIMLRSKGEAGRWTISGMFWSLVAGTVGAMGALGVIMALSYRGAPVYVMPLVFGCAPVVNTFVTMLMTRTFRQANIVFYASVIIVALGAAGVMRFKPSNAGNGKEQSVEVKEGASGIEIIQASEDGSSKTWNVPDKASLMTDPDHKEARTLYLKHAPLTVNERFMIPLSIVLTALCWGSYGPVLHRGQMKMLGSRLRPFLCVGLAYFAIAVVAPLVLLAVWREPGGWSAPGLFWSLGAGAAGALGALGIIMAFNYGGKPIFVMPLVFGGAPVVNTFTSILEQGSFGELNQWFFGGLIMVITGAVMVLIFAPKPAQKPVAKPDKVRGKRDAKASADSSDEDDATPVERAENRS